MYIVSTKVLIPIVGEYEIFYDPVITHMYNTKKFDLI